MNAILQGYSVAAFCWTMARSNGAMLNITEVSRVVWWLAGNNTPSMIIRLEYVSMFQDYISAIDGATVSLSHEHKL